MVGNQYRIDFGKIPRFTKPSVNRCNSMPNFSKTNKEALVIKTSFCFYLEEFHENIDDVFVPSFISCLLCSIAAFRKNGRILMNLKLDIVKMFLKPVWVGKIHGVEVYATHVVRIWWFSNKFSIF